MDESLLNEFFADTQGHLDSIEEDILKLEKSPTGAEMIGDVFRRVHSIKGNAGIIGLGAVYTYGQEFEAFLEGIRDRKKATPAEIEKIFRYLDGLKAQLARLRGETSGAQPEAAGDEDEPGEDSENGSFAGERETAPQAGGGPGQGMPAPTSAQDVSAAAAQARARAKAQESGPVTALTFSLGQELYGIDILKVKEIITYERITRVPNTKDFVDGVMNLRDQVIPVFDLRKKLKIKLAAAAGAGLEKSIIVVEIAKVATGLAVDEVTGIRVFEQEQITAPESFTGRISADYLLGIGQMEDGAVIILDADDLCDPAEMLY